MDQFILYIGHMTAILEVLSKNLHQKVCSNYILTFKIIIVTW